jgi:hypothetical protein
MHNNTTVTIQFRYHTSANTDSATTKSRVSLYSNLVTGTFIHKDNDHKYTAISGVLRFPSLHRDEMLSGHIGLRSFEMHRLL